MDSEMDYNNIMQLAIIVSIGLRSSNCGPTLATVRIIWNSLMETTAIDAFARVFETDFICSLFAFFHLRLEVLVFWVISGCSFAFD